MSFDVAWKFSVTSQSELHGLGLAPGSGSIGAAWGWQRWEGPRGGLSYPDGSVMSHCLENVPIGEASFLMCSHPCLLQTIAFGIGEGEKQLPSKPESRFVEWIHLRRTWNILFHLKSFEESQLALL